MKQKGQRKMLEEGTVIVEIHPKVKFSEPTKIQYLCHESTRIIAIVIGYRGT